MKERTTWSKRLRPLALFGAAAVGLSAWAGFDMTNPVTGDTETYTYKYVGQSSTWTAADWQNDADPVANPDNDPQTPGSNVWDPLLIDGAYTLTAPTLEGWAIRLGLYNGAQVTVPTLNKIQAGTTMWFTVDATSKLTLSLPGTGHLGDNQNVNFYVAAPQGLVFNSNFATSQNDTDTFNYYLAGNGSVSYQAISAGSHVIKQADVALSGTSQVASKTLVSFTSTTKTFTADAAIKVYGIDGETEVETVYLATVNTTGETTLTTSDPVGTVELVKTSTGIDLYYVDGDPSSIVAKTYRPSISVNFTSGTALSTLADVGVGDYAIPGTSWNNLIGNNGTLSTVTQVDSTGAASTVAGVGVTISGTRGYWTCGSVTAATDLRQGYIDDAAGANASPQVVVSGIPYYSYYAVVYFSNNSANVNFGYVTINGTNYKWDSENSELVECEGTSSDSWGASSPTAWTEGGNYIVTPTIVNADGTFTVVGHRLTSARAGIAAIQIVEVPKTAEEGELVINVSGDTTYTVSEDATYTTVYVTGVGTLAFDGEGTITTTTLNVGVGATVPMGSSITPTTVTGAGTVVYDGAVPTTGLGWTDSANWKGTLWVKNTTTFTGVVPNTMANANSTLRLSGVVGYFNNGESKQTCDGTLELENDSYQYAFSIDNGYSTSGITVFAKLKGSGLLGVQTRDIAQRYVFKDASEFTGTFNLAARTLRVILGDGETLSPDEGTITIASGATATVASGTTWTANKNGFRVEGTLNVNGTLASSAETAAVKGSGTVVFSGRAPTPTGDTWWKNAAWTGTVQMKNVTDLVGASSYTGTNFLPVDYGNTGSVLELYNCSGWLPNNSNYQCTVPLKITGTLTINNGISGSKFVISSLSGSGTIYTSNNSATITLQVLEASGFTGKVQLNSKRVVFGETLPSEYTVGNIYVGEGFSFTVPNSDVAWYGTGGITLAGELKAAALSNFGGGTTITTTDTGVFTLVSNSDTDDMNVDYTRIQGTGTLKFEGTNYRTISTNNFPTALVVENNLNNGLIHRIPNLEVTIGSLSGSGQMRSDWGGNGSTGDRDLRILQAKDTTYSGLFASSNDRIDEVYVAPGASTAGTLTLSGAQTASNGLIVETGASVNLTGTWVGATTVAGSFGGTGTLTGNLTFNDGATFKVFATDDNGLAVSGTVTCPAEGTVTVDVSALEDTGTFALLTASELDADKFALAEGAPEGATLAVVEGVLTLTVPTPSVSITIPTVANATVAVTVDGVAVTPENGVVTAQVGAAVVVTYTAAEGYTIANGTIEFTAAADTTTVDTSNVTVSEYIAWIYDANGDLVGSPYTAVLNAVQTFLTSVEGNSVRFKTSIEESCADFHAMLVSVCDYDDETFTYTRKPSVAKVTSGIQEYLYTSLVDAVTNAISGATVTLLTNVTLDERVDVNPGENTTLTIDLGGYTLTREGTSGNGSVFRVMSGTVTIKNGTVNCTQDDTAIVANGVYAIDVKNAEGTTGAAVVLETLSISVNSQNGACVYPWAGTTATIKSGTYVNNTQTVYQYGRFHDAELFGMAVNQANVATQLLFIEGGTFSQINPALGDDSWADGAGTFVAAGYESTEDNGVWVVAALPNYTVTFDAYGGTPAPAAQTVQKGSTATAPAEPTKDGFTFEGWTLNGLAYDFATPVTGNIMLVASWTAVSSGIDPTVDGSTQTVTPTAEQIAAADGDAAAAAIELATVTVPTGVSVDANTYKGYFKFTATEGETEGTYAVSIAGFDDAVAADVDSSVLTQVLAAEATATEVTVVVKPGLYYGFAVGSSLSAVGSEPATTLATGTSATVEKPAGNTGFIKVRVSTTALEAVTP